MTSTTTLEIDQYYERVRAALGGLTPEVRDDLLEDLPDHLAEVLAEGEGSLRDRLGEPEQYAAELYAAAAGAGAGASAAAPHRLHAGWARAAELANGFDLRAGRLVGYSRLTDLLRAIRPGWWVLRGWIVAQFLAGIHGRWDIVPKIGGSAVVGFAFTVAVIAASVWLGQRSLRFAEWPRRVMLVASAIIAAWALVSLTGNVGTSYSYGGPVGDVGPYSDVTGADATDVYVYDQNGNQVVGARLFDQNGDPIQLGSSVCENGDTAPGTGPDGTAQTWTYPLCPADPGPFRSGPGPLPAAPSASTPTSPAPPSRTAKPTSGHSASSSPTTKPTR
jgi:HAAS domain-containing protein